MSPSMDKSPKVPAATLPGYETRDANVRGVFAFLVALTVGIMLTLLVCLGLFKYLSTQPTGPEPASPFASTRQLPIGPQLQVNPREDFLRFRAQQLKSLETYQWVDRSAGIVQVPVERAMDQLIEKGLPVAPTQANTQPQTQAASRAGKPAAEGNPSR
jgi:hypothetical protein